MANGVQDVSREVARPIIVALDQGAVVLRKILERYPPRLFRKLVPCEAVTTTFQSILEFPFGTPVDTAPDPPDALTLFAGSVFGMSGRLRFPTGPARVKQLRASEMVRLSIGIEVDPQEVVQATFTPLGFPTWVRLRGPQPLAVRDTLEIETVTGTHFIRGSFAS